MRQLDIMDILKIPYTELHVPCKGTGNTYYTQGHKTNHKKLKRIEIIKNVFNDCNKIKLRINTNISGNLSLDI